MSVYLDYNQNHFREETCPVAGVTAEILKILPPSLLAWPANFPIGEIQASLSEAGHRLLRAKNPLMAASAQTVFDLSKRPSTPPVVVFGGDFGPFDEGSLYEAAGSDANLLYLYFDLSLPFSLTREVIAEKTSVGNVSKSLLTSLRYLKTVESLTGGFVAQTVSTRQDEFKKKIEAARDRTGFRFVIIYLACPALWSFPPAQSAEVMELAIRSGLWPLSNKPEGLGVGDETLVEESLNQLLSRLKDGQYLLGDGNRALKDQLRERIRDLV